MGHLKLSYRFVATLCAALFCFMAHAQFRSEAFSQQYNDDTAPADSVDKLFSLKDYFGGLSHKQEIKVGTSFAGSLVFIGGQQIYNKQYWKLPIAYSTIGGAAGAGLILNAKGNSKAAAYCFAGAGLAYWATLMDGVVSYKPSDYPDPGKATIYSLLLPGLGQVYNREYWKLPIYLGAIGYGFNFRHDCVRNYNRFRDMYLDLSEGKATDLPISASQAQYYKNLYRRYRDYATLAIAALYLLQAIDANVFAYMHGFEVDDDISLKVSPAVMIPEMQFASVQTSPIQSAGLGLRLGLTF